MNLGFAVEFPSNLSEIETRCSWGMNLGLGLHFSKSSDRICTHCYNSSMTLVEITFELQSPMTAKQLSDLAEFANTYGLRRFRHDEAHNLITFEYDASRLRQSQVVHALAGANIAVKRIVPQSGQEIIPA
jgi:hypothetical protein